MSNCSRRKKKAIAVLVDPDKVEDTSKLLQLVHLASENYIDYFFVGGSLVTTTNLAEVVRLIKQNVNIPVVLFPGNSMQIDPSGRCDAVFVAHFRPQS